MLDAALKTQLQAYLEKAVRPIAIIANTDDGAASREMLELLEDIKSTSDKITLDVRHDAAERIPDLAERIEKLEKIEHAAGVYFTK